MRDMETAISIRSLEWLAPPQFVFCIYPTWYKPTDVNITRHHPLRSAVCLWYCPPLFLPMFKAKQQSLIDLRNSGASPISAAMDAKPHANITDKAYGYTLQVFEISNAFCAGHMCQCNGCMEFECHMPWADWHITCQEGGPCTIYNSVASCDFDVGRPCDVPYGLACIVTAIALNP